MPRPLGDPVVRFWTHVDKRDADECWPWLGAQDRDGYGRIRLGGKGSSRQTAPRFSWRLANGHIPDGMVVCHRCDNPPCVNPAHLFLGTTQDNTADKMKKGRHIRGESCGMARLTNACVSEIRTARASGQTLAAIARDFGVHLSTVHLVVRRSTWRHVP